MVMICDGGRDGLLTGDIELPLKARRVQFFVTIQSLMHLIFLGNSTPPRPLEF